MLNQSNSQDVLLSGVLEIIRRIEEKSVDSLYIYRGEPASHIYHEEPAPHLKICSSLYREYQDIETDSFDIETVQEELLTEAKKYTKEIDDFKILMDIQYYGGKTNMIEFTTDYLIALFFACSGSPDKDGKVILQKTEKIKNRIYYPCSKTRNYVSIQKIVFVRASKGFIQPNVSDVITIPKNFKQSMLEYLRKTHGISIETIYNEPYGFVLNHSIYQSAYAGLHRGITWQRKGIKANTSEEKQKAYEKAIRHYTEALALKTDDPEIYYNRGLACFSMGEITQAIADYSKAIELKPDNAETYYNRGLAYSRIDEIDLALSDYNKTIELKPDNAEAYYNRGLAYSRIDEIDLALSDYNKTIELKPDNAEAYYNRGLAYSRIGEIAQAIADYSKTIELKPDNAEAYYNRSFAYLITNEVERAKSDYDQTIELEPNDTLEQTEVRGFLRSMNLRFDKATLSEPYYRIFAIPTTLTRDAVQTEKENIREILRNPLQTEEENIREILRNPSDIRKGAFGFTGTRKILPIHEGISGFNFGEGEVILLNNGFFELRCPLSDSVFQWQISSYEMFSDSEWLYPYVVCEYPVTFLRLVKALYTAANIESRILVQQEYHNLTGFLLVGRHPKDPKFGKCENERRVYELTHPIVSKQIVNPDFSPDQIAYGFVTDVYTHFGLNPALMPALFDEEHNFVL